MIPKSHCNGLCKGAGTGLDLAIGPNLYLRPQRRWTPLLKEVQKRPCQKYCLYTGKTHKQQTNSTIYIYIRIYILSPLFRPSASKIENCSCKRLAQSCSQIQHRGHLRPVLDVLGSAVRLGSPRQRNRRGTPCAGPGHCLATEHLRFRPHEPRMA